MQLTIIMPGDVPDALGDAFGSYGAMFPRMFARAGFHFDYDYVRVFAGEPLPDPTQLDAILITGSAAGVYDDLPWMEPLRRFIRGAYAADIPMVGICFGHQIIADALGGDVRKSEKGWGLGRHTYAVTPGSLLAAEGSALSIACSHQDQVVVPPAEAEIVLASPFTPNAGLAYRNGKTLTFQPHPEFDDDYATALAQLRRGRVPDAVVDSALATFQGNNDRDIVAGFLGRFLTRAHAAAA